MNVRSVAAAVVVMLVASVLPADAQQGAPESGPEPSAEAAREGPDRGRVVDASGEPTGLWVVQLDEPALSSYTGGIAGLDPTSPLVTGESQLDTGSRASRAYREHLDRRQDEVAARMRSALGRDAEVVFSYRNVVNGMAVEIDEREAERIARLPGVAAVHRDVERELDTDVSHDLIATAAIWDGTTGTDVGTRGEGVVVGMLDTGVNPDHPAFAATDGEGYTHTNPLGSGTYLGVCDPDHPAHEDICNDKLIGAWNLHPLSPSAQDVDGHGSHTGSTMAGNVHEATFTVGSEEFTRTVQGVAPRANVVSYLVCFPSCPVTSSIAAVDQAIDDGVDVLNYSISGADNPWLDLVDLAFLDAFNAGIFVSASAGNDGPGAATVAKTAPWNATVAATTLNRVFAQTVDVIAPTPVPPALTSLPAVPGTGPAITADTEADLRWAGLVAPGNELGCAAFPDGAFDDSIALIERGSCTFPAKVQNAAAAGAVAVIIANHVAGPPTSMGGLDVAAVPAVMVDLPDGAALRDLVLATDPEPVTIRINAAAAVVADDDWADVVAGFSSRGPSQFDLLAPTFAAPGVNVLAATAAADGDPVRYELQQGTSMAAPHGAGAGALLVALHPDWSPAQIRSALASTADPSGLVKDDGTTAADPFDIGSGRLDLGRAGRVGLALDETHLNFVAANPATGGDPRTLNLPALVDQDCTEACSWTRTLTGVADTAATYTATINAPEGVAVTAVPDTFTIGPGSTQVVDITVEVDLDVVDEGEWVFASLGFETEDAHGNGLPIAATHHPIAVVPTSAPPEVPSITVRPSSLSAELEPGDSDIRTLTIGNTGTADLVWDVRDPEALVGTLARATPITTVDASAAASRGDAGLASQRTDAASALPERTPASDGPVQTLTHSASQAIVAPNSVACSPDGGATTNENAFLRTFTLPDFGVVAGFDVVEVEFGIESLTGPAQTLTVNLFTMDDPDAPLTYGNLTSIGSASESFDPQTLTLATVPVTGEAAPGSTLVVELVAPDMSGVGGFWPGSNSAGQTAPTYLRSAACGIDQPVETGAVGAGHMHLVMNVTGATEVPACDAPTVGWLEFVPQAGTVAPGADQDVEVTFDAVGMSAGSHEATLCLESNDPRRPLVGVPLTLTVEGDPPDDITLTADARRQRGDTFVDLAWSGTSGGQVDIHRDGDLLTTVDDTGTYTDDLGKPRKGTVVTYRVCDAGNDSCSAPVDVEVGSGGGPPGGPPGGGPPSEPPGGGPPGGHPPGRPPPVEVVTTELPAVHVFRTYEAGLEATGGEGPYTWDVVGLPANLVLDPASGSITTNPDDPAVTGTTTVELAVTVTDANGRQAEASVPLTVTGAAAVSSGNEHVCALDDDGAAWCWGRNNEGQLGDGWDSGDRSTLPVEVLGGHAFTDVLVGGRHTCALDGDGAAWCWGSNDAGQLGDDNRGTMSPVPVAVAGGHTFTTLTVGFANVCALDDDGAAWCWGRNHLGQLGDGDGGVPGVDADKAIPVPVGGDDQLHAAAISTGGTHTCAVDPAGAPWCWGQNASGQLGTGPDSTLQPLPVPVDGGHTFTRMVTGTNHTCANDAGDGVWCWGDNANGQLGIGSFGGSHRVPRELPDITDLDPMEGHGHFTCALDGSSRAWCWGGNNFGQLGYGTILVNTNRPGLVQGGHAFADLSPGEFHTCGVDTDGIVWCWGANFSGQLGRGTDGFGTETLVPGPVHPGDGPAGEDLLRVTTTQPADLHALERYEQTLHAFGGSGTHTWEASGLPDWLVLDPDTGVLTNDPADPGVTEATGPLVVTVTATDSADPDLSDSTTLWISRVGVQQLASGWGHTCAVTTRATAYCWGRNATGQIGNGIVGGDGVHEPLPAQVRNPDDTGPLTGVTKIVGGDGHTCALMAEGTVYCWGASFDGRLGNGDPTLEPQPLPVQVRNSDDTGPLTGVADIVTGTQFGCAVTTGGELYCWGNNGQGKLGIGHVGGIEPLPVAVRDRDGVGPLTGVSRVAAGASHACAVTDDATYCWGGNFQGQLGNGTTSFSEPVPVEVRDPDDEGPLQDVIDVSAGGSHTCAITIDAAAWCWGNNSAGQLGVGAPGGVEPLPVAVSDADGTGHLVDVAQVVAGSNHTCARTSSGGANCWGHNFDGQLGTGDVEVDSPRPVEVRNREDSGPLAGVVELAAGHAHSCARTASATLRCWGGNFNRQLGIGDTANSHRQPLPAPVHPGHPQ